MTWKPPIKLPSDAASEAAYAAGFAAGYEGQPRDSNPHPRSDTDTVGDTLRRCWRSGHARGLQQILGERFGDL